ncbi:TonB-dependent receptor [Mucilaginibacter rivuli]|uniref:TonB-dependent receptor n=1 Tax=Mucilaginibacter rivuli TaxID=2857527 RepID=UPI002107055C|nr:TonB-dependent receptor [Mucilaginibacter rivuli]
MIVITLFIFSFSAFAQQAGTIRGTVKTSDGKPAEMVSIMLTGTTKGTLVNQAGHYQLKNITPGQYTIMARLVGLVPQSKNITVAAGQTLTVDFVLAENNKALQEVIVTARKNKFANFESKMVARMPLTNLENPQAYSTVSKELMAEQVVTNFSDALKNAPGLDKLWTSTGRNGDGATYYSLRGFSTQVSVVDGIAGQTNGDIDPANIEKIEVIKGPSGTLFGGALTTFGGLVNVVTKKPVDTLGGEIGYTGGSFGLNRLTADVYGPLSAKKDLLFRLNTAYTNQNSFQDAGFSKSTFIAPAIEYRATDKLTFNFGAEFYQYEGTSPASVFLNRSRAFIATTPADLNYDWKRSYTSNDLTMQTPTANIHGQATLKLSNSWTSQTIFSSNTRKSDGFYQYEFIRSATTDDLLERNISLLNSTSTAVDIQQNFIGDFKIGNLRNRLVVGVDYLNQNTNNSNSPYIAFDVISGSAASTNYLAINRSAVMAKLGASTDAPTKNSTYGYVYSVYASDVLNVTDRLLAMLSLRADRFDSQTTTSYTQNAISPKLGLVYQLVKDQVSVFGNYMNGFKNVAPVTQPLADISGTFKPQHANQLEGGIKLDAFESKLSVTASYYDIQVDNVTRTDVLTRDGKNYNITVQDASQLSKGVEFDVIANPINGLNVIAGFSYNDSKYTKSTVQLEGRRPNSAGAAQLANLWLSYTLHKGDLKGLGIGFGGNYAGKNMTANTLTTGVFTLPEYIILNGSLFYNTKTFRLGLKMNNLTGKEYFKGWSTIEVQAPRNVAANISFRF